MRTTTIIPSHRILNSIIFSLDYNRQIQNLNAEQFVKPVFQLTDFLAPDLNINNQTLRLPEIQVRDLDNSVWTYKNEGYHFDGDQKRFDSYAATIHSNVDGTAGNNSIAMDLGKMKFDPGSKTPVSYSRSYKDDLGNSFQIERTKQVAETNPLYQQFITHFEQQSHSLSEESNQSIAHPTNPSRELVTGYEERWMVSTPNSQGGHEDKTIQLRIDSIDHDSNFHRFVSGYHGTIQDGQQNLTFTATVSHDIDGKIESLNFEIGAKGAPTAHISWKPTSDTDPAKAFDLLRENLPVPVLVGPRSSFRWNSVDISEAPLKVTKDGSLNSQQVGNVSDLANLMGKQDLGITVAFTAPDKDSSKSGFSLGNAVRNLWYIATGQWSEVKGLRQQMTSMQAQSPVKFVLAAGFSDPSFMGIKELRNAFANSKEINFPKTKTDVLPSNVSNLDLKSFTSPTGQSVKLALPMTLQGQDGSYGLAEPIVLPTQAVPADLQDKTKPELTKANFKTVNGTLVMTEGVIKVGQEKFYVDTKGTFTNVKVIEQGLQKIEAADDHLQNNGQQLASKLLVSVAVTNNYLQNLHGVTGQILTDKIEPTSGLNIYEKQVDVFSAASAHMRESFEEEDYGVLQKNLPTLHDQQMTLMKQEQTFGRQVQVLSQFAERLGALTEEAKTLLPKINVDYMVAEPVTEQKLKVNADFYFGDDKKILSAKAGDVLDSIAGLADAGLLDRSVAQDLAKGVITARDRFMIAVPRSGYALEKAVDQIKDPIGEFNYAVNRKADAMFFDNWNRMAEKNPQEMAVFAAKGLTYSQWAQTGSTFVGLGALGVGIVQAPLSMAVTFGTSVVAEKSLLAMGVKDTTAQFYGGAIGLVAGIKASSPEFVMQNCRFR